MFQRTLTLPIREKGQIFEIAAVRIRNTGDLQILSQKHDKECVTDSIHRKSS